jgi:ribosomal-protein-alanine N-acetyltransferase
VSAPAPGVTIRAIGVPEIPLVAAIAADSLDPPWDAAAIAGILATPGSFGLLAETPATPVGVALLRVAADEAELLALGVVVARRRRGIGRALLHAGVRECRARGATRLFLEVAADNTAALALYRAAGFTDAGRRPGYYTAREGAAVDAVLLRRELRTDR